MNSSPSERNSSFVDFLSFDHINTEKTSTKSSIIKSSQIKQSGVSKIEVIEGTQSEPTVLIRRQGERIEKIEFVCTCGKSAHLDLQYEEE
jgi:hypothetical protein